jgi:hypothetical protein
MQEYRKASRRINSIRGLQGVLEPASLAGLVFTDPIL